MAVCGETLPLGCEHTLSNSRIGKDSAVEYFRNFKAKGQTNNHKKIFFFPFLKMRFKGKELEIKHNDREGLHGSPEEN